MHLALGLEVPPEATAPWAVPGKGQLLPLPPADVWPLPGVKEGVWVLSV